MLDSRTKAKKTGDAKIDKAIFAKWDGVLRRLALGPKCDDPHCSTCGPAPDPIHQNERRRAEKR